MKKSIVIQIIMTFIVLIPFCTLAQQKAGLTEEEMEKANNPLANSKAFNLQNYYVPTIYGSADLTANTFLIRYAAPFAGGKILMRATLPFVTTPTGPTSQGENYSSGLGDLNFFATYTVSKPSSKTLIGIGPQVVIPTATSVNTGAGKWQLGGALVVFNTASKTLQWGALITFQASVAGQEDRESTSQLALQPFGLFQLGKGTYLRSTGICSFNLHNDSYNVPFGLGIGQVLKTDIAVVNIFLEPQFTFLHQGEGQPALQVFGGINFQF
jgi:hypothetical protein